MRLHKTAILLALLLATGCSSSEVPSSTEINNAMQAMFANCPIATISGVEKTNGRPLENGQYLVDFDFRISLAPLPENQRLGKDYQEFMAQVPEARKTYEESGKEISILQEQNRKDREEWNQTAKEILTQELNQLYGTTGPISERNFQYGLYGEFGGIRTSEASMGGIYTSEDPQLSDIQQRYLTSREQAFAEIDSRYSERLEELYAKHNASTKIVSAVDVGGLTTNVYTNQTRNVLNACQLQNKYAKDILHQTLGGFAPSRTAKEVNNLMTPLELNFSSKMAMTKTEKGWMYY